MQIEFRTIILLQLLKQVKISGYDGYIHIKLKKQCHCEEGMSDSSVCCTLWCMQRRQTPLRRSRNWLDIHIALQLVDAWRLWGRVRQVFCHVCQSPTDRYIYIIIYSLSPVSYIQHFMLPKSQRWTEAQKWIALLYDNRGWNRANMHAQLSMLRMDSTSHIHTNTLRSSKCTYETHTLFLVVCLLEQQTCRHWDMLWTLLSCTCPCGAYHKL